MQAAERSPARLTVHRAVARVVPALVAFALAGHPAHASGATAEADGIVAAMRVAADGIKVAWRFVHDPPDAIDSLSVTIGGEPASGPEGSVGPFPASGQTAVIECLSASDDPAAPLSAIASLPSALPVGVTVRTVSYDHARADGAGSGLAVGLNRSIDDLGTETAERRALLLAVEGPGLADAEVLEAAARARRQDIPIYVLPGAHASTAERDAAAHLAAVAHGSLLDGRGDLAAQVARTALSGAELAFPLHIPPRLPWQDGALPLRATLTYGGRALVLATVVERPATDVAGVAAAAWDRILPQLPGFCVGVGLAATAMRAWARRERRKVA